MRGLAPVLLPFLATCPCARAATGSTPVDVTAVVLSAEAEDLEHLAAHEVRRYGYLRTGALLPIVSCAGPRELPPDAAVLVATHERALVRSLVAGTDLADPVAHLAPQEYLLARVATAERELLLVIGGSPIGTLYGAYRLAEHLGARFHLHGDSVPDGLGAWPELATPELGRPLFELRGIQPFHDFPEGPDWWGEDDYLAILGQLPKLGMNFFGLHTYPEGGVGPEPGVWIGAPEDLGPAGELRFAYPSRHFTTRTGQWGYTARDTGDYDFGAAALFDRDAYGAPYMRGLDPLPRTVEESVRLFDDYGGLLARTFTFARRLGVRTCIGTETPLTVPGPVRERLRAAGRDPDDPAVTRDLYRALFERIARTHPLDYYWLWTPEGWTWSGVEPQALERTLADLRAAVDAAAQCDAPFELATCGWVLGPPGDRTLFDRVLPPGAPLSCINRGVGFAPVDPGFAQVEGRPLWAIPWLEDDPALLVPQLWVGRVRRDAADALAFGCTGLMGIHWRTRILAPNAAALARAAWDQAGWNPQLGQRTAPGPPARERTLGGRVARFPDHVIADTEEPQVYRSVLYDLDGLRLEVPGPVARLTLEFCEPHYRAAGQRIFGVIAGGRRVVERLDVFERVGADRALELVFEDVPTRAGLLELDFPRLVEFPSIAGLVLEGPGWTRRINLGGPALEGREACPSLRPHPYWPPGRSRDCAAGDFYLDWARAEFGVEVAAPAAEILAALDGGPGAFAEGQGATHLPRPSTWMGGPGGVRADPRPWRDVRAEYAFVERLAALRPEVVGAGNLERFDYWLGSLRYLRAVGRAACLRAALEAALGAAEAAEDPDQRRRLARTRALPLRVESVAVVAEAQRHLLSTITTRGGMGTVANWQQHVAPALLDAPARRLEALLGAPLDADARPGKDYTGPPRVFLPTVRTSVEAGEELALEVIVLGARPARALLRWAPLGGTRFEELPLRHVARGVYAVRLPARATAADLEYHVEVRTTEGAVLRFPATAPERNQTLVSLRRDG